MFYITKMALRYEHKKGAYQFIIIYLDTVKIAQYNLNSVKLQEVI